LKEQGKELTNHGQRHEKIQIYEPAQEETYRRLGCPRLPCASLLISI
jgi:hypothetical protein